MSETSPPVGSGSPGGTPPYTVPGSVGPGIPGDPAGPHAPFPPAGWATRQTSTTAIVALVLAVVSFVVPFVPAVVALILARNADEEIVTSMGRVTGSGLVQAARITAWANIVLCIVVVALAVLVLTIVGTWAL